MHKLLLLFKYSRGIYACLPLCIAAVVKLTHPTHKDLHIYTQMYIHYKKVSPFVCFLTISFLLLGNIKHCQVYALHVNKIREC